MYFQIENSPVRKRKTRKEVIERVSPKKECIRLILKPFERPPNLFFEDVVVGTYCEKYLELFNPLKEVQVISLSKTVPDLNIDMPDGCVALEPESCYCLTLSWTPLEPISCQKTLEFTNEKRGRFYIHIKLKSILAKTKSKPSPGKIKKTSKILKQRITKKKVEAFKKEIPEIKKMVNITQKIYKVQVTQHTSEMTESSIDNPFETDFTTTFNTADIFPNINKDTLKPLYTTYDKSTRVSNVLKPSNKHNLDTSGVDWIDNFKFTPLKAQSNIDKLDRGPNIVCNINSRSDFDDSLELPDSNKENETHSIVCLATNHADESGWSYNNNAVFNPNFLTPLTTDKKIPKTSSPQDIYSPNFTINTDYSRISEISFPHRFSTEKKTILKTNDMYETDYKLKSDTFTKESPFTNINHIDFREPLKETRVCRQALFQEKENRLYNEHRFEIRSPPRSLTPPLQSIPEESFQFSETTDRTSHHMETFIINRTFDRPEKSINKSTMWSKKAVVKSKRCLPTSDSMSTKINQTYVSNKSMCQSLPLGYIPNVYSQSLLTNPFSSSTLFCNEALIKKFEKDFKDWLNNILTPPDLETNIEQKIDIGQVWIDSKSKEVPTAPTKEKVCISYHNSHRLERLRKSAKALLTSPEICDVMKKLNTRIDGKLINIREDRNIHLNGVLQKTIMEIILSYNPLWLRIGLEVIYNCVLPLKTNSDVRGLTSFVVQRMFINPFPKGKSSKVPNMHDPAYVDAVRKNLLKKFFLLVLFLDKAKAKKLISHDPCLFRRNAVCKESREVLIRFTRELIAAIGDINKHVRPTGYVVSHKQTYLDEYKYGVNNIAVDLRDGVRLTKLSELILLKDNLLKQLRTPAISRFQKIHNVEVALKALRGENFNIEGEITATDVADGHREKTLSLLWQLIHVFRAPLYERAAADIQMWWRKKYEVIKEERRIQEEKNRRNHNAASVIQYWWRQIQYKRRCERRLYEITCATITVQKYTRMWLCRTHLMRLKRSVLKIELWYHSRKLIREAKATLCEKRENRRRISAIVIQAQIRRWLCMKKYQDTLRCTVKIQSAIRRYLARKRYLELKSQTVFIQTRYRSVLLTRKLQQQYTELKKAAITIQRGYRALISMRQCRQEYDAVRNAVVIIQRRYRAQKLMKIEKYRFTTLKQSCITIQRSFRAYRLGKDTRKTYLEQRNAIIKIQSYYKAWKIRQEYICLRRAVVNVQIRYRAQKKMYLDRSNYVLQRNACITIQTFYKAFKVGKEVRYDYLKQRSAVLKIQDWYRSCKKRENARRKYIALKISTITVQRRFRAQIAMRIERSKYLTQKRACLTIQRFYVAYKLGKQTRSKYLEQRSAAIKIQAYYRAWRKRREYTQLKRAVINVQRRFRAQKKMLHESFKYNQQRNACVTLQTFYRAYRLGKETRSRYLQQQSAVIKIQCYYRTWKTRKEYLRIKQAVLNVQSRYRALMEMRTARSKYIQQRNACITIQRFYRSYKLGKRVQFGYLKQKAAALRIQDWYRSCKISSKTRQEYVHLKQAVVSVQRRYRANKTMYHQRSSFERIKQSCITIQRFYRAYKLGTETRNAYLKQRNSALKIQTWYRSCRKTRQIRQEYECLRRATITLQQRYRAQKKMAIQRLSYRTLLHATIAIQRYYKACRLRKQIQTTYLQQRIAAITIQNWYRNYKKCNKIKLKYQEIRTACITIQTMYRTYILVKKQSEEYMRIRAATVSIQRFYRSYKEMKSIRQNYLTVISSVVCLQRRLKAQLMMQKARRLYLLQKKSAIVIQNRYKAFIAMKKQRVHYLEVKKKTIKLQACVRGFIERKSYLRLKAAAITIQCIYRLKIKRRLMLQNKRENSAVCIQKNWRRYVAQTRFQRCVKKVVFIQRIWRGVLLTKPIRNDFLRKRETIVKIQARARGHLVRTEFERNKEKMKEQMEERRQNWAATKIQALCRGNTVRNAMSKSTAQIRQRLREKKQCTPQKTIAERNEEAFEAFTTNWFNIGAVLRAFKTLELTVVLWPQLFAMNASRLVQNVFCFISCTNRSLTSVEILMSAATFLVNLIRYPPTGPKCYQRDYISCVLKHMLRFSIIEPNLICRFGTYIWLFSKYEYTKKDLTKFLNTQENYKTLLAIKSSISRWKKMEANSAKVKYMAQSPHRNKPIDRNNFNMSMNISCHNAIKNKINAKTLPNLNPDYGIINNNKPRFFLDPETAIDVIIQTYIVNKK